MNNWRSDDDDLYVQRDRMTVLVRLALVAFVLVVIVLLWFILSPPESRGVIYVQAPRGPVKTVPAEPGGYRAEERGGTVYKLVDDSDMPMSYRKRRGNKEMTVVHPARADANNYYSIHSDVVNIYTDEETPVPQKKPMCDKGTVGTDMRVDMDLATFNHRNQAVNMTKVIAKDSAYRDIAKMCRDKVLIIQKDVGGRRLYSVTVVDLPEKEAQRLCRTLKGRGRDCLVRR